MKKLTPEAVQIVEQEMERLRGKTHEELQRYLEPLVETRLGESGRRYELEIQAVWDDKRAKTLRVMANIAEVGHWKVLDSSVDDFIIAPDGSFIGE